MIGTERRRTARMARAVVLGLATVLGLAGGLVPAARVVRGPGAGQAFAQGTAIHWPSLTRQYEQQTARTPNDPSTHFTLAMLYARDGRILDAYSQIQAADRAVGDASQRQALTRQIIGEAEAFLRQNPADLLARYRLAFARYFSGDRGSAIAEMQRIVNLEPRNEWGYGYLGAGYSAAGQDNAAIATWERGLKVNPNNAVLHYLLGLAYNKKGDKKKAAAHLAIAYRDRTLYEYVTGGKR